MANIPFSPPDITEAEINEVCEALRSGWITTGPRTKEFERRLAEYCGTQKVACLNSATAALELNLRVLGIGEGDEVIVPAYTYTASASAVAHVGAKIVFIDSQPDSFEMNYDLMEEAINEKTKAIIPVDLAGVICDYDRIFAAVENKKHLFSASGDVQRAIGRVAVVADCAHALGAEKYGKKAGAIADFTSFSFHAVKNLTTAEGGAATWRSIDGIDNGELYQKYMLYSLHGQSKDALSKTRAGAWEYDIVGPWYKCNMTDITAAIGIKQLERYPSLIERRKEIIMQYNSMCDSLGISYLNHYTPHSSSSGHLYITRIPGITEEIRNCIITDMAERGIACNVHYKPLPMMTAYKKLGFDIADFPNAYSFYAKEITLPLHTKLSDEDVKTVCETFAEVVKKYI
ncbi:MAG: DegT/DnrJ/EryC1/StrS family aminotransferase [Clostridia bacterium]|nr:DegT/DnrJ/EryC1/StrS family aminotransferase [Clostridia bacterium]